MKKNTNNKGFTLVELLIAVSLMAIGILAMVQMQIVAIQSNSLANRLSVATNLAQEVMDDIQSWDVNNPPADVVEDVGNVFDPPAPDFSTTAAYTRFESDMDEAAADQTKAFDEASLAFRDSGTYTATYTITLVQPDLTSAFISVTVTGGGRTVTLTSLKRIA